MKVDCQLYWWAQGSWNGKYSYEVKYDHGHWSHDRSWSSGFDFPSRLSQMQQKCSCEIEAAFWAGPKIGFLVWGVFDIQSQVKAGMCYATDFGICLSITANRCRFYGRKLRR